MELSTFESDDLNDGLAGQVTADDHGSAERPAIENGPAGRSVGPQRLIVPTWCVEITSSVSAALVLAWIRYWLEPRQDATGPRSKVADGSYHWAVGSYAEIATATGLTPKQVRTAIKRLIDDGLVIKRDHATANAARDRWALIEGVHRRPRSTDSCYRLDPWRVLDALETFLDAEGTLEKQKLEIETFVDAASSRDGHAEAHVCGGWYRSPVQALLDQQVRRNWIMLPPALIGEVGDAVAALILAKLVTWHRWCVNNGRPTILTRTREQIASETGIRAIAGRDRKRHSRIGKALTTLVNGKWITRKLRWSRQGKSYIEIRLTQECLNRLEAIEQIAGTGRTRRQNQTKRNASTANSIERKQRRRPPCPQHDGELDGRRYDRYEDCYVWDDSTFDDARGEFVAEVSDSQRLNGGARRVLHE